MRYTEEQLNRLATMAIDATESGHTEYSFDDPTVAARYIVGGIATLVIPARLAYYEPARNRRVVTEWLHGNTHAETLGYWIDAETGDIYLDAGDTYGYEGQALSVARQRGELAIWDRVENREIRVDTAPVLA